MEDKRELFEGVNLGDLRQATIRAGWEILRHKGATSYGIATTAVGIIKAILYDQDRIIPVSTLLSGEFGEEDVYAGVPCILNGTGVKDIVELLLTVKEKTAFHESVDRKSVV